MTTKCTREKEEMTASTIVANGGSLHVMRFLVMDAMVILCLLLRDVPVSMTHHSPGQWMDH